MNSRIKLDFNPPGNKNIPLRIIGLNSGTSCDGLDVSLVEFGKRKRPRLLYSRAYAYPRNIKNSLLRAGEASFNDGERWMLLDSELGVLMGKFTGGFSNELEKRGFSAGLIGSHGHTIRHLPDKRGRSHTLQLGDPARIAEATGLPVVSDFRKSDIAAGGQGAPLSSILHLKLFGSRTRPRAVLNIGGIANITVLPPSGSRSRPFAADCGPGNMIIDEATRILFGKDFDNNGRIASEGTPHKPTIKRLLQGSFFGSPPPKSTGRELFGRQYTESIIKRMKGMPAEDIIATVSEITVLAIAYFISKFAPKTEEIFVCGGGAKNRYLVSRIAESIVNADVKSTAELGYDPDYIESMLWAYLACCFVRGIRVVSQRFTGAAKSYIPGRLCLP